MMPLAFSVNLGGMATLFATSNILASATLVQFGLEPLGLFDFAPTGLPLAAIGIAFMVLIGWRRLPAVSKVGQFDLVEQPNLTEAYALEERLTQVRIDDSSPLIGRTIGDSRIGENLGLNVLAVHPADQSVCLAPGPDRVLAAGDTVLVAGRSDRVQELAEIGARVLESPEWNGDLLSDTTGFVEAIPAPRGGAANRTLKDLRFRERYGLSVVAIWRGGRSRRTDVGDIPLQFGDALLLYGGRDEVDVLRADPDFLVLSEPVVAARTGRGWLAAVIMLLALIAAALNLLSLAQSMMLGGLAMVLVGCLTMEEAYRSIDWRVIFLVAGMLPIGIALSNSGAADWIGQLLVTGLGGFGLRAVLAGLMLLAVVVSQFMPGQVATAVLTPIAIAVATQAGANPYTFAIGVAAGCAMVYVTPLSHAVNMLVAGPGGYRFRDFFRTGLPMAALMYVAAVIIVPLVWPLTL
jgi:di/tricarboxylate transporter